MSSGPRPQPSNCLLLSTAEEEDNSGRASRRHGFADVKPPGSSHASRAPDEKVPVYRARVYDSIQREKQVSASKNC
jgi:hypothetical protein